MTPTRVIDTQRLSTLAHEHERELLQLLHDLNAIPHENGHPGGAANRILRELQKAPFESTGVGPAGNLLARLGSGSHTILLHTQGGAAGAPGLAAALYAGKLIHELGMYDDFTLWVANSGPMHDSALRDLHADCLLLAEPTKLCIEMREAPVEGFLHESHPLVQAAIATYENLFELPPIVSQAPSPEGPMGIPAIAFGACAHVDDAGHISIRHLLQAAQFYAAFPTMYVQRIQRP